MRYASDDGKIVEFLWNSRDGVTPFCIGSKDGKTAMHHIQWQRDEYRPEHELQPGDRYFATMTEESARNHSESGINRHVGTEYELHGEEREEAIQTMAKALFESGHPDILTFGKEGNA